MLSPDLTITSIKDIPSQRFKKLSLDKAKYVAVLQTQRLDINELKMPTSSYRTSNFCSEMDEHLQLMRGLAGHRSLCDVRTKSSQKDCCKQLTGEQQMMEQHDSKDRERRERPVDEDPCYQDENNPPNHSATAERRHSQSVLHQVNTISAGSSLQSCMPAKAAGHIGLVAVLHVFRQESSCKLEAGECQQRFKGKSTGSTH